MPLPALPHPITCNRPPTPTPTDLTGVQLVFRSGELGRGSIARVLVCWHTSGQVSSKTGLRFCPFRMSHTGQAKGGRLSQELREHGSQALTPLRLSIQCFSQHHFSLCLILNGILGLGQFTSF